MGIIILITSFACGVVVGMYVTSQIETHIDKNIKK
tara:strand:+ start:2755 stop:2859 length:105 start_codon:yes stop_codon:yes gene_type:complete